MNDAAANLIFFLLSSVNEVVFSYICYILENVFFNVRLELINITNN
jgi:hypothetical protein